ncbi:MAG TPA: hypothetical protein H9815_06340 [Candidatus Ruania gallistercoris]|uniref:Uncharacterized protein n=1 Tax=Candidatus Ruania gallistercoris TaxID=2838746 RepID=A0A9D2J3Q1_9MICO|nr:hypothetical protein [Candidatus Ruania gallistercoris]
MTAHEQPGGVPGPPRYGTVYGAIAVLALALNGTSFYFGAPNPGGEVYRESLWKMLERPHGMGLALVSLLMIFLMIGLCAYAAIRPVTSATLPVVVTLIALSGAVMLILKVGWGDSDPALDDGGIMLINTALGAALLGIAHTIHLIVWRARSR